MLQTIQKLSRFAFNSIKVRLKLVSVHRASPILDFQFHKGTIKTVYGCKL